MKQDAFERATTALKHASDFIGSLIRLGAVSLVLIFLSERHQRTVAGFGTEPFGYYLNLIALFIALALFIWLLCAILFYACFLIDHALLFGSLNKFVSNETGSSPLRFGVLWILMMVVCLALGFILVTLGVGFVEYLLPGSNLTDLNGFDPIQFYFPAEIWRNAP